jgi:DNA gyrase subunit A
LVEELAISETQADSILAMPMRRLTGLERQKLETEHEDLQQHIAQLETILGDRHELLKALKKELRSLKRKFGDERRTRIVKTISALVREEDEKEEDRETRGQGDKGTWRQGDAETRGQGRKFNSKSSNINEDRQIQPEIFKIERAKEATLEITQQGYIYWQNPSTQPQSSSLKNGEDFFIDSQPIGDREQLIAVTDSGKAYPVSIEDLPAAEVKPQQTLLSLLPNSAQRDANKTVAQLFLPEEDNNLDVILLTEKAIIKRIQASELDNLTNRGLVLIKLKEQDRLKYVTFAREDEEIAIATTGGRILRFLVNDEQLPVMGRSAQGNPSLRLRYGEELAGCATFKHDENLLLISQSGYGKRIPVSTIRLANRGDIGTQGMQFNDKTDNLAGMILARAGASVVLTTTADRRIVLSVEQVPFWGKDGVGERVAKLNQEEKIVGIYPQPLR